MISVQLLREYKFFDEGELYQLLDKTADAFEVFEQKQEKLVNKLKELKINCNKMLREKNKVMNANNMDYFFDELIKWVEDLYVS